MANQRRAASAAIVCGALSRHAGGRGRVDSASAPIASRPCTREADPTLKLYLGKNHVGDASLVRSVFRLAGSDEDALTYALGFLLAHDPDFCSALLRLLQIAPRRARDSDYSIHLQEVTDPVFGRRDIVIENKRTRIVLEAKIGGVEPTLEQLLKYARQRDLWDRYSVRGVVALTQVALSEATRRKVEAELGRLDISFGSLQWHQVIDLALGYRPGDDSEVSRYLFDQFTRYIRRDYRMGYYDAEILIQDVNRLNAKIFEKCWMYVTSLKDKRAPLYFAPYRTGRGADSGIYAFSRVLESEVAILYDRKGLTWVPPSDEHRKRWLEGLDRLRERAEKEGFADRRSRLLYLDRPVVLWPSPMSKKSFNRTGLGKQIPNQIPKGFSLRFDELLAARSGLE